MGNYKIEHLVATLNCDDMELDKKLKIETDAIIANQNEKNEYWEKKTGKYKIRFISTDTRGVGKNRNIGLIYSNADICILSDDDMRYKDGYIDVIKGAFEKLPDADVIIFNIETIGDRDGVSNRRINKKIKKINFLNFMNYGAARLAFKLDSIKKNNIYFSTMFGGGARYSSGEDTLFLAECLRKKLKIYTYPQNIASVRQESSTWFNGFNEKFFFDKGALLSQIHPKMKYFYALFYFPIRFKSNLNFMQRQYFLCEGIKNYSKGKSFMVWQKESKYYKEK